MHDPALGDAVLRGVLSNDSFISNSAWADRGEPMKLRVKLRGGWMFLYRAVDDPLPTVESPSRIRGIAAAKEFFRRD
jgi:hypothetical protein